MPSFRLLILCCTAALMLVAISSAGAKDSEGELLRALEARAKVLERCRIVFHVTQRTEGDHATSMMHVEGEGRMAFPPDGLEVIEFVRFDNEWKAVVTTSDAKVEEGARSGRPMVRTQELSSRIDRGENLSIHSSIMKDSGEARVSTPLGTISDASNVQQPPIGVELFLAAGGLKWTYAGIVVDPAFLRSLSEEQPYTITLLPDKEALPENVTSGSGLVKSNLSVERTDRVGEVWFPDEIISIVDSQGIRQSTVITVVEFEVLSDEYDRDALLVTWPEGSRLLDTRYGLQLKVSEPMTLSDDRLAAMAAGADQLDGVEVLRRKELFAPAAAAPVLPSPSEGGNYAILLLLAVVGLGVAAAIVFSRRRGAA